MVDMKILFIGDVVSSPGREMVENYLPKLKSKYHPYVIVINGENAAGSKGMTEKIYTQFVDGGTHVITMGKHTWAKKEIFDSIDEQKYTTRPANFPEGTPGKA